MPLSRKAVAPAWSTTHAPRSVDRIRIDLVRGRVDVVRRPGAVRIDAWILAGTRHDADVRIRQTRTGTALRVFDVYPPQSGDSFEECLPPAGERGAFWSGDGAVKIIVFAPDGVRIDQHIMASSTR